MTVRSIDTAPLPERTPARPARDEGPQDSVDLTITRVDPDSFRVRPGQRVWFDVEVANQGSEAAPAFDVTLDGWGVDDRTRVPGLEAGESATLRMGPLTGDSFTNFYWVDARVDAGEEVQESREDNNWLTVGLPGEPIPPPPPPIPDPPRPPIPPRP